MRACVYVRVLILAIWTKYISDSNNIEWNNKNVYMILVDDV